MDIDVFSPRELPTVFRVLRAALSPEAALEPPERAFLDTYARITGYAIPSFDPAPVGPLAVIDHPHRRKRLLQLASLAVLLSNPVRPESVAFLRSLASHLGVHDPVVDVAEALRQGRRVRVRLLAMRRTMRVMLKESFRAEGAMGILRVLGAMFLGRSVNKDKLWAYKRLGLLPEGTLGREYWKHMTEVGFGFPGEHGGIPDAIAYHDIGHVLAGNDTTPLGEIQQGSFQGGNRREDGFHFIQFVVLQFHHGIKVTPVAPSAVDHFDPAKVLWAIHRGASMNVDITHQWDYWPLLSLPIEEARARCALLPKLPLAQEVRIAA